MQKPKSKSQSGNRTGLEAKIHFRLWSLHFAFASVRMRPHGKYEFSKKGRARLSPQERVHFAPQKGDEGFRQRCFETRRRQKSCRGGRDASRSLPSNRQSREARNNKEKYGSSNEIAFDETGGGTRQVIRKKREYVVFSVCSSDALVVQRIERKLAELVIWVRFPARAQANEVSEMTSPEEGVGKPAGFPWRKDWENRGFPSWRRAQTNAAHRSFRQLFPHLADVQRNKGSIIERCLYPPTGVNVAHLYLPASS